MEKGLHLRILKSWTFGLAVAFGLIAYVASLFCGDFLVAVIASLPSLLLGKLSNGMLGPNHIRFSETGWEKDACGTAFVLWALVGAGLGLTMDQSIRVLRKG